MSDSFVFFRLMYDTGMKLTDPVMRASYFESVIKYGLDGTLPEDPVMLALINGAVFSIDKCNSRRDKISEGMKGNSNAQKTWDIVSKQMKTDENRKNSSLIKVRSNEVWSIEVWSNEEKKNENKKNRYMDFVFLTESEHSRLVEKFWSVKTNYWIERLNSYIGQIWTGSASKKYKSHYFTILNRERREWWKSSTDYVREQALTRHRDKIREQIDQYLHPNDSTDVWNEKQPQAFDRRGEVFGS